MPRPSDRPLEEMDNAGMKSILVVDDESILRDLCQRILTGYLVHVAADSEEALDLLEREEIDIVLTDVSMPGMSGLDFLKQIKEREPDKAVVIMTGHAEKEVILEALKSDADDFITKPINLLQLKTTVERVLERKRLKEELIQLKRTDRLKTEFLGLVSHKLKTPVTAISLFIQNLAQGIVHPDGAEYQETLDLILEESSYLESLIEELLQFSDVILNDEPLRLEELELEGVLVSVLKEIAPAAEEKNLTLVQDLSSPLPILRLDRRRVQFALRAVLENAVKFTPEQESISVSAEADDAFVRVTVRDTGPGIAKEELPKVFEKFYQVDPSRTGQIHGFGLGLFYARKFMRQHGGSLHLESASGDGTLVSLVFPRN